MRKLGLVLFVALCCSCGDADDAETVCENILDCLGGGDVDACADELRGELADQKEAGCGEEYSAYLKCGAAEESCDELTSEKLCAREFKKANDCAAGDGDGDGDD